MNLALYGLYYRHVVEDSAGVLLYPPLIVHCIQHSYTPLQYTDNSVCDPVIVYVTAMDYIVARQYLFDLMLCGPDQLTFSKF